MKEGTHSSHRRVCGTRDSGKLRIIVTELLQGWVTKFYNLFLKKRDAEWKVKYIFKIFFNRSLSPKAQLITVTEWNDNIQSGCCIGCPNLFYHRLNERREKRRW